MNHTVAGSDDQARFQTASVHQVLPSSMHGGLVCLCGKELPKYRDATEHIIDAYDKARRRKAKIMNSLDGVLIRSVERQELQCDLCEWRWLVPEWDENDVWSVAMVAKEHWSNNHERSEP